MNALIGWQAIANGEDVSNMKAFGQHRPNITHANLCKMHVWCSGTTVPGMDSGKMYRCLLWDEWGRQLSFYCLMKSCRWRDAHLKFISMVNIFSLINVIRLAVTRWNLTYQKKKKACCIDSISSAISQLHRVDTSSGSVRRWTLDLLKWRWETFSFCWF